MQETQAIAEQTNQVAEQTNEVETIPTDQTAELRETAQNEQKDTQVKIFPLLLYHSIC